MKTVRILTALILLLSFGCSTDDNVTGKEFPQVVVTDSVQRMSDNPVSKSENGNLLYKENLKQRYIEMYPDAIWVDPIIPEDALAKRGKGKGPRVVQLSLPASEPQLATQAITNIMLDPVTIPDTYAQPLPEPIGQFALVDWDGDGVLDEFEIHNRCFFPRSFSKVTVNGVMINNSISYNAQILGFDDVDGDGDLDVLLQGGNHRLFNAIDGINNGPQAGEVTEPYSPYNVGYNTIGETPQTLKEMIDALVVTVSTNNPEFVRWNFGNFLPTGPNGELVSQYEAYVFHVMWRELDANGVPTGLYYQTVTYGEWGVAASYFTGALNGVWMRFTNADEDSVPGDECADVEKIVII